ncbi:PIN domain-like protein [Collybia nuda]|uniref:PIN domain-like protein n=1 Tax=Collybia nuda TaxID=64659 RepID=A0A9P5YHU5_9AGAR|nr:PIN domain-like protein [Collybia nuda]
MGVQGLTPFLQKFCPEVIKQLPNRFRSLSGKRLAIDSTLITQRFHYAQAPHPYRHVLGWYRLVKELNDAGVSAICVFDGKERNVAKARETERRREVQRVTMARGSLENDRSKRFRRLSRVLNRFRELDTSTREKATEFLRQLSSQSDAALNATTPSWLTLPSGSLSADETSGDDPYSYDPEDLVLDERTNSYLGYSWQDEQDALLLLAEDAAKNLFNPEEMLPCAPSSAIQPNTSIDAVARYENTPTPLTHPPFPKDIKTRSLNAITYLSRNSPDFFPSDDPSQQEQANNDVPNILASLYLDYRRSKSNLSALPNVTAIVASPGTEEDAQTDVVMTKAQLELTVEEGHFWEGFFRNAQTPEATESTLATLSRKSSMMYESYQRRTNTPTARNYEECREIIQAMGIPCINSAGVEAEALASSLVINGFADYVASEDTDVLVYEAPLIRNLTNRQEPLVVLSGADIRDALQLSRASFVDFALLLGTDFSQRIKNIGPARALRFIKEHGSIERVIEAETKYPLQMPVETYMAQVSIARVMFGTLPAIPEKHVLEGNDSVREDAMEILQRYGLGREVMTSNSWNYSAALDGNYFEDNPHTF